MKTKYNLPSEIIYCSKCVESNQRPSSLPEYLHKPSREGAHYINMQKDKSGDYVCDACKIAKKKEKIDWKSREKELLKLLNKHRSKNGEHDCIVPGSGGKDSTYAAHILKYKYGMNPLTVTWAPHLYTDIGFKNFTNWVHVGGFDNILYTPNGKLHRYLTKLAFLNLGHPFQPFIHGQKIVGPLFASKFLSPVKATFARSGSFGLSL